MVGLDVRSEGRCVVDDHEHLFVGPRTIWAEGYTEELFANVLRRNLQYEPGFLCTADSAVLADAPFLRLVLSVITVLDDAGGSVLLSPAARREPDAELGVVVPDAAGLAERPLLERTLAGDGRGKLGAGIYVLFHRGQHVAERRHDVERPERRLPAERLATGGIGGHRVAGHDVWGCTAVGVDDSHDGVLLIRTPAAAYKVVPLTAVPDSTLQHEGSHLLFIHF